MGRISQAKGQSDRFWIRLVIFSGVAVFLQQLFYLEDIKMLLKLAQVINQYLSDYILIIMLIGVGLYYTVRTRFVQVRCLGEGFRRLFDSIKLNGEAEKQGMSTFQALATAVAGQVGTGNIVGAAGAILLGGPGAIFWMWIIAFLGMATIYAEAVLAIKTRTVEENGTIQGGPVYYITKAFPGRGGKRLAAFFAFAVILALGFFGAMVQSNSIAASLETAFHIPGWIIGLVLAALCWGIYMGGIRRLAAVTEKLVPIMAGLFLTGALVVLAVRFRYIPATFAMIFRYAFRPDAIIGGSLGAALKIAISQGAKRGLFSNEAGMGSTPHAHAQANVENPHDQGIMAMVGVFIDTFVVLTMNALVIISTLYAPDGVLSAGVIPAWISKTNLAQTAFGTVFGTDIGAGFVAICLLFFAFSTILSWNLFGRINMVWLFGEKASEVYTVISVCFVFLGTLASNDLVWELTDMFNNLMVIPNSLALFALGKYVSGRRS